MSAGLGLPLGLSIGLAFGALVGTKPVPATGAGLYRGEPAPSSIRHYQYWASYRAAPDLATENAPKRSGATPRGSTRNRLSQS